MIFRPDRRSRADDRFLPHKTLIFALGAMLGIAGIAFEIGWIVYAGIAVLALGVILRFASARGEP